MQQSPSAVRRAGDEPVAGYRLLEPLGSGGFGDVWKCEAPGGINKAIKFVGSGDEGADPAAQEMAALQRIKSLRHPFILSLDRIEFVDGNLILVMELADQNLSECHAAHQAQGQPGIPRNELVSYLREAAEALDWMNFQHGLQHLDVKPHNLFLVSNHVKVADFGLVETLGDGGSEGQRKQGGVTPLYSAPEMLRGTLSRSSDQYSLAVVYQQMLTGTLPFWNKSIYDLMMLHLTGEPDLSAVPPGDHAAMRRALSKVPDQRFGSCSEFIDALANASGKSDSVKRSGQWRRIMAGPIAEAPSSPPAAPAPPSPPPLSPSSQLAQTRITLDETPTKRVRSLSRDPQTSGLESGPATTFTCLPATPVSADPPAVAPLPTAASLPGYRFVSCVSQTPLGDYWQAEDSQGRPCRALVLLGYVRYDERLISHLQALRDPMLLATEIHWSAAERLVLLAEPCEGSLRDLFEKSQAEGERGVPHARLLSLLRSAAEVLDRLSTRHGIQHLGLNPSNLFVDQGLLRVADFGIIPLVWIPTGETVATINGRYSAPELFGRRASPSADQYSLALIYAEMLTGVHPRPQRPGSGPNIRRPSMFARSSSSSRTAKFDLDMLPVRDREVVIRALSPDPSQRFSSCLAFIEALEAAAAPPKPRRNLYRQLPGVIPYRSLMGEPPGPDTVLPGIGQLVVAMTEKDDPPKVDGPTNSRYRVLPDGSWQYCCPLQLYPGALAVKIAGFISYWHARVLKQEGETYLLDLEVPGQRSFWSILAGSQRVQVHIAVDPSTTQTTRLTEAKVQVRFQGDSREQASRVLSSLSPKIFDSIRTYLQTSPEQRNRDRWPLTAALRIYPVLPDLELADTIEATTRNISLGGLSIMARARPPVDRLYLHLHGVSEASGYAILGRMVRCQEAEGGYEIGLRFLDRGE